jgi:hypothetical protein
MDVFLIIFILSILLLIATFVFYQMKKNKKYNSTISTGVTGSVKLPSVMVSSSGLVCMYINQNQPDLVIQTGNIPNPEDIPNNPLIWKASSTSNFNIKNSTAPYVVKLDADASGDLIMYDSNSTVVWKASTSGLPFNTTNNKGGPYKLVFSDNYVYIYDVVGNNVWSTDKSNHAIMKSIEKNNMELASYKQDAYDLITYSIGDKPTLQKEVSSNCSMLPNRKPNQSGTPSIYDKPIKTYPCAINDQIEANLAKVDFQPPLF